MSATPDDLQYCEVAPDDDQFAFNAALAYNLSLDEARRVQQTAASDVRGLYRNGRLATQCVLHPLRVAHGGGGTIPVGGIGMVATPPEARRRGYVARLLRDVCDELRRQGTPLSILSAFKESFYRRYGWATFYEARQFRGAPAFFAAFRAQQAGAWVRLDDSPSAVTELDAIYRSALRGRFGPLERPTTWWQTRLLRSNEGSSRWAYVWRDDAGHGRSYVIFHIEHSEQGRVLQCREAVALDPQARAQIFAFFAVFENQCVNVVFNAPADAPVQTLMPDPLQCAMTPGLMLRIVDVPQALEAYSFPQDVVGRLTLHVIDDWMDHNNGIFALEVEGGGARVKRLDTEVDADICCDVRTLTQIYSRYVRPRTAAAFGLLDVRARTALALFERLFAGLAPYASDRF
ncbi:enhanced intracellular survival protein Eis [Roseiflexus sp.]|uniref:GNAT family N-acetyltransferase n=1 Tax=Roseiflexus sp. TaxID=2562120 RepID=UPI00398A5489